MAYDAARYWGTLHSQTFDESTVGYPELAVSLNAAMYRSTEYAVRRTLAQARIDVTGRRVLDIGSGTGVWVDFWRRQGAGEISGVDLAEGSVRRLRERWPDYAFSQVDVGDERATLPGGNELVSAMSILLHIVDRDRFHRAISHLAGALSPDGVLVAIEPVVVNRWWGPEFGAEAASLARDVDEYRSAFAAAGLTLDVLRPATVLLANVVDTRREITFQALEQYWSLLTRAVGKRERVGHVAGSVLGPLDRLATRVLSTGPSAKVLVARRTR